MAEIAVNLVIDKLIPLLRYEVTVLRGVHREVESITHELRVIRAYLKDADVKAEKAETSDAVKEWVKQVREVARRIEDVIDEYLLQVAERRQRRGLAGLIEKIARLLRSIEPRHGITMEIREINGVIVNLDRKKETLRLGPSDPESSTSIGANALPYAGYDLRRGAHFSDDAQLVGISDTTNLLKGLLKDEDLSRTVIAVVGTGGLGKTTVVKKLYDKQKEKGSFDCCAWISVSSSFEEKKILRKMLQTFYEDEQDDEAKAKATKKMDNLSLIKALRDYLQEKSYMIVFDDVWAEDFWGRVEFALPENNKRSRILITTRNKKVAEFCKHSAHVHIHELQCLSSNNALSLFHQKAFKFKPEGCPKELQKLSEEIVKTCDGVPLAIVAIASLLSTKNNNVSGWQKVHDSLGSKLGSDPHLKSFYQVLSESYHDLPYHLKPCLLYFGLFPDDYSISCAKLIRLWVAEGFVKVKENDKRTPEEVAEEYLDELILRSLVIVSSKYLDGRDRRSCRVHDLMHDFILDKGRELDFCQVIKSQDFNVSSTTRRLSIQFQTTNEGGDALGSAPDCGRVRFTFAFNFDEMPRPWVGSFLSSFKLLVGLDFEDGSLDYLPPTFGNLLHLKYLNLRNTNIKDLPKFVGKLQSLEYLDVRYTQVRELPIEINRLIKLRHLLAYSFDEATDYILASSIAVKIKEGIGRLTALQMLSRVDMTSGGDSLINELRRLKQLRRLGVAKLRRHDGKMLCSAIECMTHLQSLDIGAADEHEFLDLNSLNDPPYQHLQRLYLYGRLGRLPTWLPRLPNLVKLVLNWSGLMEDPLIVLQDLSELLELELYDAYEGDELHFREGRFKKLKVLYLEKMQALKTIKIDRGALPGLEKLTVGPFPRMVEVPHDIQNLDTLQMLRFYEMPMDPEDIKQSGIFQKIPFVIYSKDNKFYTLHNQDALNSMDS